MKSMYIDNREISLNDLRMSKVSNAMSSFLKKNTQKTLDEKKYQSLSEKKSPSIGPYCAFLPGNLVLTTALPSIFSAKSSEEKNIFIQKLKAKLKKILSQDEKRIPRKSDLDLTLTVHRLLAKASYCLNSDGENKIVMRIKYQINNPEIINCLKGTLQEVLNDLIFELKQEKSLRFEHIQYHLKKLYESSNQEKMADIAGVSQPTIGRYLASIEAIKSMRLDTFFKLFPNIRIVWNGNDDSISKPLAAMHNLLDSMTEKEQLRALRILQECFPDQRT